MQPASAAKVVVVLSLPVEIETCRSRQDNLSKNELTELLKMNVCFLSFNWLLLTVNSKD